MAQVKKYGFVIDPQRCIDCRACLVACRAENNVPLGATRIWVYDLGVQGTFPNVSQQFVPYNCMHCDDPPCVEVCPSQATYKREEDGIVVIDQQACIGCGLCLPACPYHARFINPETGKADKCNACLQRVEQGEAPACVATCIGGARLFGDLNDPNSEVSIALRNARRVTRLTVPGVDTGPNIYYINDEVDATKLAIHPPEMPAADTFYRRIVIPGVLAAAGLTFLGQAAAFARQLVKGESEYEE
ncbi:MAG: 4Fe-4S ferredoxin [Chloroflexota bacterium]